MNSRVPHSAEFLGRRAFTFKRDLRCLDTAPSEAVPTDGLKLQRMEVWSSAPPPGAGAGGGGQGRDKRARSTFSVCLSLRLPPSPGAGS